MENKAHQRYKWICQQLEQDAEYLYLMNRLSQAQPEFQAALDTLPPEQREAVREYIGILGELSHRTMELGCYVP